MNIVELHNYTLIRNSKRLLNEANLAIKHGEQILLIGSSGCGKTSVLESLVGKVFANGQVNVYSPNGEISTSHDISYVSQFANFKDKTGLSDFYYQQRFNSYDSTTTVSVREYLASLINEHNENNFVELVDIFKFHTNLDSSLLFLSSGERKKLQLIQCLLKPTNLILLDNPYIGLDKDTVSKFNHYLAKLATNGTTFIIVSNYANCPEFISHIVAIDDVGQFNKIAKSDYIDEAICEDVIEIDGSLLTQNPAHNLHTIVKLTNVNVGYGEREILRNLNWEILAGDKWQLAGENGAGKSTLLSLINGDHPQAYANDIILFDKKRGSGETIWDIKRKIGYISPELHWNFDRSMSCLQVVLSGFFDTPGLYHRASDEQQSIALAWLNNLHLNEYITQKFAVVPAGIQRLCLLLRALVKNPPLFIFDEPCQGLDEEQSKMFMNLVDKLFADSQHTIIYVSHVNHEIPQCISQKFSLIKQL